MRKIKSQRGQALILIALGIVGLVGFTALTIDGGRVLIDRRSAQNAADTAALAAAVAKVQGKVDYVTAAEKQAKDNGYVTDSSGNGTTVTVITCDNAPSDDLCQGLPAGLSSAKQAEYIRVRIVSIVPTTFARVVGRSQVQNVVESIVHVAGASSSGSLFSGAGMVSTKGDASDQCWKLNGSANVVVHGAGIFVNCTGASAAFLNGSSSLTLEKPGSVAGGVNDQNHTAIIKGTLNPYGEHMSDTQIQNLLKGLPTTKKPVPTCNKDGVKSGALMTPGNYDNITVTESTTMQEGIYCFNGNVNIQGNGLLNGPTGTVKIVLGRSITLGPKKEPNTFKDLEVYTVDSDMTFNGQGALSATRFRFYSTGSGKLIVNDGSLSSSNAYIYLKSGTVTWNGSANIDLHAPPQNDPDGMGGILINTPWSNTNDVIFNGGTNINVTGTILFPHSKVQFNGGNNFNLKGQIIGYTFNMDGNGNQIITYNAQDNYNPPMDPTIQITK